MKILYLLLFLMFANLGIAQDSLTKNRAMPMSKMSKISKDLKKSLDENDEEQIGQNYERLAKEFAAKGDQAKAEEYYKKALSIDPGHRGALEYIGELYVDTKRLDLANATLKKLENCRCEEYAELKSYINK